MPLRIVRLEERLLFDASATAVIADAAQQGGDGAEAPLAIQADDNHENQDTGSQVDTIDGDDLLHTPVDAVQEGQVNVLMIASHVQNAEYLAQSASDDVITILYDAENATLESLYRQIESSLTGRKADTIGFASHGNNGLFHLSNQIQVSAYTLTNSPELASFWSDVGSLLKEGGRVDLLGCNIADGDNGLLASLDAALDASGNDVDLAASYDMTGNGLGENWVLEVGNVDAGAYFNAARLSGWIGHLVTYVVTNTNDAGAGSLRQAILDSNATPSIDDMITFDMNVFSGGAAVTITSGSLTITDGVTMTGMGSLGAMDVEVAGSGVADGFVVNASGETVVLSNLAITDFTGNGVVLTDGDLSMQIVQLGLDHSEMAAGNGVGVEVNGGQLFFGTNSLSASGLGSMVVNSTSHGIEVNGGTDHVILESLIGIRENDTAAGNGSNGITFLSGAGANTVIGLAGQGNIISGNTDGISGVVDGLMIKGNIIGLASDGDTVVANTVTGIANLAGADDWQIGGTAAGEGNVISGNSANGIVVGGNNVTIEGNFVGTDQTGQLARGNAIAGVFVFDGSATSIGTASTGGGNLISANLNQGIALANNGTVFVYGNIVGLDIDGDTDLGNGLHGIQVTGPSTVATIGGTTASERNIISGNTGEGIVLAEGTHTVTNNYIGTDITGQTAIANNNGLSIGDSSNTQVLQNVISGNNEVGLFGFDVAANVQVYGNIIGLDKDGADPLANLIGIGLTSGNSGWTIGAVGVANRNIISGNTQEGIITVAPSITFKNNYIGTDITGAFDRGNGSDGIQFNTTAGAGNVIGGDRSTEGNLISGNSGYGIHIKDGSNYTIEGNIIGLNQAEDAAIANDMGGLLYVSMAGNDITIGGTTAALGNVVSGNGGDGIFVDTSDNSSLVTIQRSFIGINSSGSGSLGNSGDGAEVQGVENVVLKNNIVGNNTANGFNINLINGIAADFITNSIGVSSGADIGNMGHGILITGDYDDTTNSVIQGNYIGFNGSDGLRIDATDYKVNLDNNRVGIDGTADIGNTGVGINLINVDQFQTVINPNFIGGNDGGGIIWNGSGTGGITNTHIGIGEDGVAAIGNTGDGILLNTSGSVSVTGNVISANSASGLRLDTSGHTVKSNIIGLVADESAAAANSIGISVNASGSTIGGNRATEANIISGNTNQGIKATAAVTVQGNYIGLNSSSDAVGNSIGIELTANANTIGGNRSASLNNVIGGNTNQGIYAHDTSNSNLIYGNIIGLNESENAVRANGAGVHLQNSSLNKIGSTTNFNLGNVISGNSGVGLDLQNSDNNEIVFNSMGTDFSGGAVFGNQSHGIHLREGSSGNFIGRDALGNTGGNLISGNNGSGILLEGTGTANNTMTTNSIGQFLNAQSNTGGVSGFGFGNKDSGITITNGAGANSMGGDRVNFLANAVGGNGKYGIDITGAVAGQVVQGNLIGIDMNNADVGNKMGGINSNTDGNTFGGSTQNTISELGNVISFNQGDGIFDSGNGVTVQGNYVGTFENGLGAASNAGDGVHLTGDNFTIGGTSAFVSNNLSGLGNVIGNSGANGIRIEGDIGSIQGNIVGADVLAGFDKGNTADGIFLTDTASGITIGGDKDTHFNFILSNDGAGIHIDGGSGHTIEGNQIGVNRAEDNARPNQRGIFLEDTSNVQIGSATDSDRTNVISGNTNEGILIQNSDSNVVVGNLIGTNRAGTTLFGNLAAGVSLTNGSSDNFVGIDDFNNVSGNTIAGNAGNGVQLSGAGTESNRIVANAIGRVLAVQASTGGASGIGFGNNGDGVEVGLSAGANTIGGDNVAGLGNVIGGNAQAGIQVINAAAGQTIQGNLIGINAANEDIGNQASGISSNTSGNIIGGNTQDAVEFLGNVVSFNDAVGISDSGNNVTVQGNRVGTHPNGFGVAGNQQTGIFLVGDNITIGGTSAFVGGSLSGLGNIVSNNGFSGIQLDGDTGSVQGNVVGLDVAAAFDKGNTSDGITLTQTSNNMTIGGDRSLGLHNIISGNDSYGVDVLGGTHSILGNFIGVDRNGDAALGNTEAGVLIAGTSDVTVGGDSTQNLGNVISGNATGVQVDGGIAKIFGNTIGLNLNNDADRGNAGNGIFVANMGSTPTVTIGGDRSLNLGNVISGNNSYGVRIEKGSPTIQGNNIGLNAAGDTAFGNNADGISLAGTDDGAQIIDNYVAKNLGGVRLEGGDNHVVQNNRIGTDATGQVDLGNTNSGLSVESGTGHQIGGDLGVAGNLISGNDGVGVNVSGGAGATIQGNIIGLNLDGDTALGNVFHGVQVQDSGTAVTIGGTTAASRNIISGNMQDGVSIFDGVHTVQNNYIGTDISGELDLGNLIRGLSIGSGSGTQVKDNLISGNNAEGILGFGDASNVIITGNIIGLDKDGADAIANSTGIAIGEMNPAWIIGGAGAGERNVISGNTLLGIDALGDNVVIKGNYIGTDATGLFARGHINSGVQIRRVANAVIGGPNPGEGNLISGNGDFGVFVGGLALGEDLNPDGILQGNYIGVDATGLSALPNGRGFWMQDGDGWTVGGVTEAHGNVISGNNLFGIIMFTDNNLIQNNIVGLDANGDQAVGNGVSGVVIASGFDPVGNQIFDNVISGNGGDGVVVISGLSSGVEIKGNTIGLNKDETEVRGNALNGVHISGDLSILGGTASGEGNVISGNQLNGVLIEGNFNQVVGNEISGNQGYGVVIDGAGAVSNPISSNSIFNNVMGGILLANGGNNNQDAPFNITANFNIVDEQLLVQGFIDGPSGISFLIEFFADAADAVGGAQGRYPLDSIIVVANSPTFFSHNVAGPIPSGIHFVSLTATNLFTSDTSEFSSVVANFIGPPAPPFAPPLPSPDLPLDLFLKKRMLESEIGADRSWTFRERGFLNARLVNQMTSNGSELGYDHLALMGDQFLSFTFIEDEVFLLNRNREYGFGVIINALNHLYAPYNSRTEQVQDYIEDLSGQTPEAKEAELVPEEQAQNLVDRVMSWFD